MMTIGVFSERTGLRPKTLRFYEEVRLLVPEVRLPNGYRQYGEAQVETAILIHSLRQADVGIADIRRFLAGDSSDQEMMLQSWREEAEAKVLSLQVAKQFLQGFHPRSKHIRLIRWEEPKKLAWLPLPPNSTPSVREFDPEFGGGAGRKAANGGSAKAQTYYVRYNDANGSYSGEIGYEVSNESAARWMDGEATLAEYPRTLFATIECNPDQAAPCKPIFAAIRESGFEPVGTPLRQYVADAHDRYLLLVPVMSIAKP